MCSCYEKCLLLISYNEYWFILVCSGLFLSRTSTLLQCFSHQIKSNQILFIWHLSYFKSKTKCLTEAKNNNDIQHTNPPTPINTQRDTETNRHIRTHKHTSSEPLHLSDRDMAGHPDLRQGKSHLGGADHTERAPGPRPQGAPPQRQSQPGQTRGPIPRCRVLQPPGPEQSTGQHPR